MIKASINWTIKTFNWFETYLYVHECNIIPLIRSIYTNRNINKQCMHKVRN